MGLLKGVVLLTSCGKGPDGQKSGSDAGDKLHIEGWVFEQCVNGKVVVGWRRVDMPENRLNLTDTRYLSRTGNHRLYRGKLGLSLPNLIIFSLTIQTTNVLP